MAYRYQKELDYLAATKHETNITEVQYVELTDAIKAQGGSADAAIQVDIAGYENAVQIYRLTDTSVAISISSKDGAWHSFDDGLPVEMSLGKAGFSYGQTVYSNTQNVPSGPVAVTNVSSTDGINFTGVTQQNQAPAQSGIFGAWVVVAVTKADGMSDDDIEYLKKNFTIKIG